MSDEKLSQYVDAQYFIDRLAELDSLVDNTNNTRLWESRKETVDKIKDILSAADDLDDAIVEINRNYDTFCAAWLDGQEVPLIPTPWQKKAASSIDEFSKTIMLCARKVGKSSLAGSYILWECINSHNVHHIIFAPTRSQLWVMNDFIRHVRSHPLFSKGFVGGGTLAKTNVEFDATNSSVTAMNIGQHGNYDLKRGVAGNRFWIDEIAIVSEEAREELIDPLMRESIGGQIQKKQILIGTPKLSHNPNLKQEIQQAIESDTTNFIRVTCWDAVDEGIKDTEQLKEAFKNELRIPCHWTQKYGVCPEFLPHWFDGVDAETAHDGQCPCLNNDSFLMEEMAEFPLREDRFFPAKWINATADQYSFMTPTEANPHLTDFYMAVDIGLMTDPTAVLIGHIVVPDVGDSYIKIDYWEEIPPFDPMESASGASNRHLKRIKKIYHAYEPRKVFVDATKAIDTVEALCSNPKRIPSNRIYADDTMSKRNGVGIWWSKETKTDLYLNYKRMLEQGRIKTPGPDYQPEFWQTWFDDHFLLEAEPTKSGNYLKFGKTGHTIDAAAMLNIAQTKLRTTSALLDFKWN